MTPLESPVNSGAVERNEAERDPKKGPTPKGPTELNWFSQFKFSPTNDAKYTAGMYFSVGIALCFTPAIVVGLPLCFYAVFYKFAQGFMESSEGLHGDELAKHAAESVGHFASGMFFFLEMPLFVALKAAVNRGFIENESILSSVKFMEQHHTYLTAHMGGDQQSTKPASSDKGC